MAGSYFSSETPKGHKQRFNKDKVTSYKVPEGQDVQRGNKVNHTGATAEGENE